MEKKNLPYSDSSATPFIPNPSFSLLSESAPYLVRPEDAIHRPAKLARGRRPLRVLDRRRILTCRAFQRRRDLVEEQLVAEADGGDEAAVGRPVLEMTACDKRKHNGTGEKSEISQLA